MTISTRKITAFTKLISALADRPSLGSTTVLKQWFDSSPEELRVALNGLIDDLIATTAGSSGAESIGSATITGVAGNTPYAQLVDLKAQLNGIVLNQIPDASITIQKLAADIQARISQIYTTERAVANLLAQSSIANRVDGASSMFYDLNDGLNGGSAGKIDLTTTNIPATTSIGVTTVTVNSVTGFAVGQEVTIMDDVNLERNLISAINTGTKLITFTASLTKAYKANAQLCRSSVVQDTTNKLLKFGGWATITAVAVTSPTTVVASAYDTSGNGGRKLVRLSNEWLVAATKNGTTSVVFEVSKDKGATWSQLCFVNGDSSNGVAITSNGTMVYGLFGAVAASTGNSSFKFDATTVTNVSQSLVTVDSGQTAMGNASLTIDGTGTLHAAWVSKNTTYPNSFNLRNSKSTDGGATWAAPTQVTTVNTTGVDHSNNCIIVKANNNPVIISQYFNGSIYTIYSLVYNGASWNAPITVYAVSTYSQSNPCAIVKQYGSNIGRIICRWNGLDSTDTTKQNERWSYSDDGGTTWSALVKITTGNTIDRQKGVLAEDANGNIYNIYMDGTGISYQQLPNGSTTWGAVQTLNATGTNPAVVERLDFSVPLTAYMDASQVKFKGTWQAVSTTPVLVEDVRYNITPPSNVSSIVGWVDHDADPNFSVAGAASFQASGGNEIYTALTKTTAAIDSTHNEDQFTGSGTSAAKATLRLTLTRNSTSLVKNVQQITGSVGT